MQRWTEYELNIPGVLLGQGKSSMYDDWELVAAPSLYGTTPTEVRQAVAELAGDRGFGNLAHDFFARLTQRFITYHLSRELSAHVGPGRRFADVDAHEMFLRQLRTTCEEAAGIVREFAGRWYGKTRHASALSRDEVRDFVHGALKKMIAEFHVRGGGHART